MTYDCSKIMSVHLNQPDVSQGVRYFNEAVLTLLLNYTLTVGTLPLSRSPPLSNLKYVVICVKLIDITNSMLIKF